MVEKLLNKIAIDTTPHYKWEGTPVLGNYKLNYETYEDEKKIWRTPKNKNNLFRTLRPELFKNEMVGLLRKRAFKFKRIGEDK